MANRGRSPAARFQFGIRMMDGSSRRESAQTSPAGIMSGLTSAATKRHQKGQKPISGPNPCFELVPRLWLFTIVPDLGYQFIQLVHHGDGLVHAGEEFEHVTLFEFLCFGVAPVIFGFI